MQEGRARECGREGVSVGRDGNIRHPGEGGWKIAEKSVCFSVRSICLRNTRICRSSAHYGTLDRRRRVQPADRSGAHFVGDDGRIELIDRNTERGVSIVRSRRSWTSKVDEKEQLGEAW